MEYFNWNFADIQLFVSLKPFRFTYWIFYKIFKILQYFKRLWDNRNQFLKNKFQNIDLLAENLTDAFGDQFIADFFAIF
ncbi:hypothetical protein SPPR111872_22295 [Sphingobacterium prati]